MNSFINTFYLTIALIILFSSDLLSQVLKHDDFIHKNNYWYWRSDGNQSIPTIENGLLKLHLQNAINTEYCNTEIYDPTEPYSPGTQVRIRLKCSPQHVGSRGWGFWDGDLDGSILTDFDVAWVMQQESERTGDEYNWFFFGSDGNLLTNRQEVNLTNIVNETNWNTYKITWLKDTTLFHVNDSLIFLTSEHIPDEQMRFDIWIDNRVTNKNNPFEFWNNIVDNSEILVDFVEITGIDGQAINRDKSENILLWKSPNTFPNGAKNSLWKQYSFNTSTSGEALLFLTASAESYGNEEDDDDIRIVLDKNDLGWDTENSFNGNQLNGKGTSISLPINLSVGEHQLDIYSDITPYLRDIIVLFSPNGKVIFNRNYNETANESDSLWKSLQFNTESSDEVTILISGTGLENDEIRFELDNNNFGWKSNQSIDGNKLQGFPNTVALSETLTPDMHTLKLFKKGNPELFTIAIYENSTITSLENNKNEPDLVLVQSNPNPFNISTKITYQITESSHVKIRIINILGQEITTLVNEFKNKGRFTKVWNANNKTSGIYFCILESNNYFRVTKLLLLK